MAESSEASLVEPAERSEENSGQLQNVSSQGAHDSRKSYNNVVIGGSTRVHMGDSSNVTNNYYSLAQQRHDENAPQGRVADLLLEAVKSGQHYRIKYLLCRREADVDHVYEDELTALHFATWCGHVECVKILVEEGADVNVVSFKFGTPLCVAVFRDHVELVELLVGTYKADIRADGGWFGSALHAACLSEFLMYSTTIRTLLDHGALPSESKLLNLDLANHILARHPAGPEDITRYIQGHPIHIASLLG